MIRKAERADIAAVSEIYKNIHALERQGKTTTGWLNGIYPVEATALAALGRGDLFVCEKDGTICASAIINQIQVDTYADCEWKYDAENSEVMVLHTLTVEPAFFGQGIGREFVKFYEDYARENGCKVLRMDTNARNLKARAFYEKAGYIESGCAPCVFNGIPDVKLVMLEKKV